jgi:hypothetical protein
LRAFYLFLIPCCYLFTGTEEERDAPNACKSHKREDYSRCKRARAAEYPADNVKAEKSDTALVERADYNK